MCGVMFFEGVRYHHQAGLLRTRVVCAGLSHNTSCSVLKDDTSGEEGSLHDGHTFYHKEECLFVILKRRLACDSKGYICV